MTLIVSSSDTWFIFARDLGINIGRKRTSLGISQERLAYAAGISAFTYRKLEKGESNPGTPANPRLRTLVALAEVLGTPVAELLPPEPGNIAVGKLL